MKLNKLFSMLGLAAALVCIPATSMASAPADKPTAVKKQVGGEHRIQMCKALGMNAVCIYIFWNIHEQREGEFDFTGNNDVAEFCRLAQKNGMYVIVRPGPYVCAEWEMGGLPWWPTSWKE